ncbi:type VII secretion-associated serine protease mycosin [Streptomyces tateyamensis]|uniref:type VII secretion-associated serine protease mycosin n=1 Tax=Streptomyces tateyamensis TaxID=565073 RepID=UPI0015E8BFF0|nr:type VII secretion-associated serine protease mycosin [Streptomyces tateyamensis]
MGTALATALALTTGSVFAVGAQAADNPRQGEWYLDALHLPEIWQTSTGNGITVAIIDTGVKADHPDLVGQLLPGKDFSGLSGGPEVDPDGHGTGMASIIAGSGKGFDGNGVKGLAPGARILPIKIDSSRDPSKMLPPPAFLKQVDQAITYAVDQGAQVINISQAVRSVDISPADVADLQTAVNYAISKGRLVVAGAGNSGQEGNPVMYPADVPGVAAVAAHDHNGSATSESEHGKYVALAAPGVDTVEACIGSSGYCQAHGTSDSTAMVSASAALVWSLHPSWTGNQVLKVLIDTANKPNDGGQHSDYIGFGNISPRTAVQYTGDPGPADVNPLVAAGISVTPPASEFLPGTASSASVAATPTPAPATTHPGTGALPGPAQAGAGPASGSGALPLVLGGALAALLVLALVIVLVVRRNRMNSTGQPPYGQS